jgi:hypothetical protein
LDKIVENDGENEEEKGEKEDDEEEEDWGKYISWLLLNYLVEFLIEWFLSMCYLVSTLIRALFIQCVFFFFYLINNVRNNLYWFSYTEISIV